VTVLNAAGWREAYRLLERSQASPSRPSDRTIMKIKMYEEGL